MLLAAKYIFPITKPFITGGAILVKDDKIADIGELRSLKLRYPDEELIDYGQAAIIPGFVDLYTRLEMAAIRGVVSDLPYIQWLTNIMKYSSKLERADWYDSAILGGLDALSSGITTVADITPSGAAIKAASVLGLRGVFYRQVGAPDKNRVDHAMRSAEQDIRKWRETYENDLVKVGIAPADIYVNHPEIYRMASEFAIEENLPVALRLAGSREEYNFVKYGSSMFSVDKMSESARGYFEIPPWLPFGVSPVRYALNWGAFDAPNTLVIHAIHVDDEDLRMMHDYDVSICVCPRSNTTLGMGMSPIHEYLQLGFKLGIGTDSPAATESTDMFAEIRTALHMVRASDTRGFMTSQMALELATIGGARALGLDDQIGSLEVGKQADLVAVDLSGSTQSVEMNPVSAIVNTALTSDVLMTMVGGKSLYTKTEWNVSPEIAKNIARVIEIRANLKS